MTYTTGKGMGLWNLDDDVTLNAMWISEMNKFNELDMGKKKKRGYYVFKNPLFKKVLQ